MTNRHTPGPWMAAARYSTIVGLPVVATPNGRSIANVTFFDLGDGFDRHDEQSYANARLIAAAPELLEALIEILGPLRVCSDNQNVRDDECLPVEMTMGELRKARAAIAKATHQPDFPS